MLMSLFLTGCLVGFFIAMPVGPIGMLCVRHSLMRGMPFGLVAGLGAALADTCYGAAAGCGLTILSTFLENNRFWLQIGGALFLWYLGIMIFFAKPESTNPKDSSLSLARVFFTTFALTLTNPLTILSFAGVYAGIGIGIGAHEILPVAILTLGVLIGSAAWWLILSCGVSTLRHRMVIKPLWLNRISGSFILLFALTTSFTVLQQILGFTLY